MRFDVWAQDLTARLRPKFDDATRRELDDYTRHCEWNVVAMLLLTAGAEDRLLTCEDVAQAREQLATGAFLRLTDHYVELLDEYEAART